jgi:hypothetical protein
MDELSVTHREEDTALELKIAAETRQSLISFLGRQEGERIWHRTHALLDLDLDASLDFAALEQIADELKTRLGSVALVGHSLSIQARTYRLLDSSGRLKDFLRERKR